MYNMYGKYCLLFVLNMALLFKVNFFLIGYCKGLAVYLIPNSIATKHNCKYTSPPTLVFFSFESSQIIYNIDSNKFTKRKVMLGYSDL